MTGKQLKNSILQWAMQGKLVPQDPNDEPASVLLERIREEKARLIKEKKIKKDKNESIIYRGDDNSHYEKILATGEVRCIDSEIPFEIPENWCWVRMQDVLVFINGRAYKKEELLQRGKYKVLRVGNFFTNQSWYYSNLELPNEKYCYKGDLLYAWSASFGPRIWEGEKTIFHYHIWNVKYDSKLLLKKYLYYFLEYDKCHVKESTTGSTMIHVSMENMNPRLLPIPPLAEQQKIVERIEALFPIIEKYDKAHAKLDLLNTDIYSLLKKSILQEAIQGRLVEQCEADEPATELLKRIQQEKQKLVKEGKLKAKDISDSIIFKGDDNKYYEQIGNNIVDITDKIPFDLPNNWVWCRLSTLMQILTGKKDANYGDEKGPYEFFTCSNTPLKSTTYSYDGDYLIMPGNGANIGQIIHYTGRFEAYQRTYLLHAYSFINLDYLKYHLMCNWKEYNQDKLYGSAIPYIKLGNLTSYLVALPPLVEQQRIVDKIEQSLASIMSR